MTDDVDDREPVVLVVPPALDGQRLDRVVAMATERSRAAVSQFIDDGLVLIDGMAETSRNRRLATGQTVEIDLPPAPRNVAPTADASVEFVVVHDDADLIVVDKPADLVVHPGAGHGSGTLVNGLLARYPEIAGVGQPDRPGIVHRLDRGTSGLMVVARTPPAYERLVAALGGHDVERQYRALVWGHPDAASGLIDAPIGRSNRRRTSMAVVVGGRPARTHYEVVAVYRQPTVVAELVCRLETGRTHQIRVHLSSIGHGVVGDDRYGPRRPILDPPRPWLHAERLAFEHPTTGTAVDFTSPLPPDLTALRDRLG